MTIQTEIEVSALRLMFADALLASLRFFPALIAIITTVVMMGAIMYAIAKSIAFIVSLFIGICSI